MRIQPVNNQYQYNNMSQRNVSSQNYSNPNFNGKFGDAIGKFFGKHYAEPMCNKKWLQDISEKMSGASSKMTQHMATLGSFITSGVYMYKTLTNKNLDSDKRKTLSINQLLCFIIPTACAYGVDHYMKDFNKNMEYRYSGLKEQQMALGKLTPEQCEKLKKSFGNKLKGFGALAGLATFTLIYRYITPVLITPVANKIGDWMNSRKAKEAEQKNAVA